MLRTSVFAHVGALAELSRSPREVTTTSASSFIKSDEMTLTCDMEFVARLLFC